MPPGRCPLRTREGLLCGCTQSLSQGRGWVTGRSSNSSAVPGLPVRAQQQPRTLRSLWVWAGGWPALLLLASSRRWEGAAASCSCRRICRLCVISAIAPSCAQTLPPLSAGRRAAARPERVWRSGLHARYTNRPLLPAAEALATGRIEPLLMVWGALSKPARRSPQPLHNRQRRQLKNKAGRSRV